MTTAAQRLTPAELRELFLFADLDDEQLAWVAAHGDVVAYPAGAAVSVEGEPAECFSVLLDGTLRGPEHHIRAGSADTPPSRPDEPTR